MHRALMQIWLCYFLCLAAVSLPLGARANITTTGTKSSDSCLPQCMCLSKTQILCNSGGFKGIPPELPFNVEELTLSGNDFREIRREAFSRLRHLRTLTLDRNNISVIRQFAFSGLSKLTSLSIQYTPLDHVDEFSFAALQNVTSLVLANNRISYIKGKAFAGSSHITYLMLSYNPLKTIHSNAFSGLTYVENLVLPSGINSIESDAFNGLEYVGLLKLTFMDLDGLKPYTFRGLKHVRSLVIQTSDLGVIYRDAFFGVDHVEKLYIISNKIDAIEQLHLNSNSSINSLLFHKNHVLKAPRFGDAQLRVNSISAEENHFPCDCQIHLILESDFANGSADEFRRKNFCMSTPEASGRNMSLVDLDSIASCSDRLRKDNYGSGSSLRGRGLEIVAVAVVWLDSVVFERYRLV